MDTTHFEACVTLQSEVAAMWGPDMALTAALGSMFGHLFPVWLRFKGGKGVATTLGVLLALHFLVGLAVCLTWLAVALLFRMSSLAGLLSLTFFDI